MSFNKKVTTVPIQSIPKNNLIMREGVACVIGIVCDFTQMLTSNEAVKLVSISVSIDIDISMHVYICHVRG